MRTLRMSGEHVPLRRNCRVGYWATNRPGKVLRRLALEPDPFVPRRNFAIGFQRCKNGSFEPAFAMYEDALVLFQMAQFVGFDFVLFDAGVCPRGHSTGKATSCLLNFPLSKEIGAFDRASL